MPPVIGVYLSQLVVYLCIALHYLILTLQLLLRFLNYHLGI